MPGRHDPVRRRLDGRAGASGSRPLSHSKRRPGRLHFPRNPAAFSEQAERPPGRSRLRIALSGWPFAVVWGFFGDCKGLGDRGVVRSCTSRSPPPASSYASRRLAKRRSAATCRQECGSVSITTTTRTTPRPRPAPYIAWERAWPSACIRACASMSRVASRQLPPRLGSSPRRHGGLGPAARPRGGASARPLVQVRDPLGPGARLASAPFGRGVR
jgi:hypothetical protein